MANEEGKDPAQTHRKRLPSTSKRNELNLWSILTNCMGKELSKIAMPVEFNEPLSFLQRISEYMEYSFLLQKANESDDPIDRIQYVAAFAVSALASNWERLSKPFNPLLGETYELVRDDIGFRIICEQVSHHPPLSAFHADSSHFNFYGSIHPKLKFWGKSIEIKPEGTFTVELLKHKEFYTWANVNCCVHNIIIGKLWFEQYGVMDITCHTNGLSAELNFKSAGGSLKDLHQIEGFVFDKEKSRVRFLYGKWTHCLKSSSIEDYEEYNQSGIQKSRSPDATPSNSYASKDGTPSVSPCNTPKKMVSKFNILTRSFTGGGGTGGSNQPATSPTPPEPGSDDIPSTDSTLWIEIPNSIQLWQADPRPEDSAQYYHFTLFAMSLNELEYHLKQTLPPTDCRLRPDIRKLEEGNIDGAAVEKNRLEEKQRDARKQRKKKKIIWEPCWFKQGKSPYIKEEVWLYKGGYWDRDYSKCGDIF